jgi:hypothetical protein
LEDADIYACLSEGVVTAAAEFADALEFTVDFNEKVFVGLVAVGVVAGRGLYRLLHWQ